MCTLPCITVQGWLIHLWLQLAASSLTNLSYLLTSVIRFLSIILEIENDISFILFLNFLRGQGIMKYWFAFIKIVYFTLHSHWLVLSIKKFSLKRNLCSNFFNLLSLFQAQNNCRTKIIWKRLKKLIKREVQDFLQVHLHLNDWRNYRKKKTKIVRPNSEVLLFIGSVYFFL